jgi:hypothetical protein
MLLKESQLTENQTMQTTLNRILLLAGCLSCAAVYAQKFDNLALTPPMAWNSWNKFGCEVNEELIRQTASLARTASLDPRLMQLGFRFTF